MIMVTNMNTVPRSEYPRPQFVRENWQNLNGLWDFAIDNGNSGRARKFWEGKTRFNNTINVPFCPESVLSGLGYKDFMEHVWYRREIEIPESWLSDGSRVIFHIGACDYRTELWINGVSAGFHIGGYISFSFDITKLVHAGNNTVVICADDYLRSGCQPGGKQCTEYYSTGCSYTRTTGIWQTVWMECVPHAYIKETKYTPIPEENKLIIEAECESANGMTLSAVSSFNGEGTGDAEAEVKGCRARIEINLSALYLWNTKTPNLYDLKLTLGRDTVKSYFGMRSIVFDGKRFLLNGKPVYERLILDQGFYPDGIYTAPTDDELKADIQRALDMGFNGARLHQKIFEPRFLCHCDKMGYLVWGEHGNWGLDISRPEAWQGFLPEWIEELKRDFNHPAIVGWCPLNETQKDQNPYLVRLLYDMTRAIDPTRPFIDCSGWCHVKTDVVDMHDYTQDPDELRAHLAPLSEGKSAICSYMPCDLTGCTFVSEYGGIWWNPENDRGGWGYGDRPGSGEEFIARYKALTDVLLDDPNISAFCYTQLTDVEQEVNGLYYYDRRPKFDPAFLYPITSRKASFEED